MSQHAAQWSPYDVRLIHVHEAARLLAALRGIAVLAARVLAAAGFAAVIWLVLAGPGFLDGGSSTVDQRSHGMATRMAR